ncbi:proteasome complex subunit Rpn13 ubiquitin receptor-domain-containing protein [Crepidotus variabilis]|uniref:Proteasome complex subunit Rpn13 ubiquitin receptor-domain-containing protein n=1 Tax=Crepidotus variabilis TaxID=179855 RepID=A0A9P6JPD5_9AGAR|nr:proteasome complex subunit Rpn13 ubiquitin receptor-domain-containing protein [Crepidotus variabilis]
MSLVGAQILLAFKAGRAFRREGSNTVIPNPTKGAIYLTNGADDLLHFIWRNRDTGELEEDLILFQFDASFVKVSQSGSGRVYVLKFASSNQRHFFWMQDASSTRDTEFVENLNGLLQDPDFHCHWSTLSSTGGAGPSSRAGASSSTAAGPASTSGFQATPQQLATLQQILMSGGRGAVAQAQAPDLSLTDILTPGNLLPLFTQHPELVPSLFPHLPPDLPVPPSADALQRIIHSPQFRSAVSNFDQALRTGMLGGLVRTLGLPEEAGTGIGPFLRAIQEQADREQDNNTMDTD